MIDYDPPFDVEFTADAECWESIHLPWNEEDEDLDIELLLSTNHDF